MDIFNILVLLAVVIVAMTFHEVGHAYVAKYFGDDTAFDAGRVTFNPIKHIDPIGTIALPLVCLALGGFFFGYAKPVPVNAGRLRNPPRDMKYVALAGPAMNIFLAIVSAILVYVSVFLAWPAATEILATSFEINIIFAIFNMIPVPPLDGSKVLQLSLPWSAAMARRWIAFERYGFLCLMAVIFLVPMLFQVNVIGWVILGPTNWLAHTFLPAVIFSH